jgi:hypothetical protein
MTYHPNFWLAAATAAPVIALSSILVNGDQLQLMRELERAMGKRLKGTPFLKWSREARQVLFSYSIVSVVTVLQALALSVCLFSLASEFDLWPPKLVAAFEIFGLFMLISGTLTLVNQKSAIKGVGQAKRPQSQRPDTLRYPPRKPQSNALIRASKYRETHATVNARRAMRGPQPRK